MEAVLHYLQQLLSLNATTLVIALTRKYTFFRKSRNIFACLFKNYDWIRQADA